jgi:ATP-dependent Lon protease
MADRKHFVPDTLPILPVRDTVLFPGAVLPLTVGRESSLALVNSLSGDDKLLGVVAQLDPRIEDPAAADLHKVGTLAKVPTPDRLILWGVLLLALSAVAAGAISISATATAGNR